MESPPGIILHANNWTMKRTLPAFIIACSLVSATAVQAQCPGSFPVTLYSTDFEANNGGFTVVGTGDWEYGVIPDTINPANCGGMHHNPGGAHSGTHGWGTVLNGCYNNLGAFSTTSLTIDLSSPTLLSARLNFAEWFEVFVNFDYLVITANGTEIYRNDTMEYSGGWLEKSVDLATFLGQSTVNLQFKLYATTVVNRTGWYIDDVSVTGCSSQPALVHETGAPAFKVWPVPASDRVNIAASSATGPVLGWSLMDVTGRTVAQGSPGGVSGFSIDVSRVQGAMILELQTASGRYRQQLIIK